jgi:hypothetical protein
MLPYTAVYQNSKGKITHYLATASNDRRAAWKQLAAMKEDTDENLIMLVPGNHPVITYADTLTDKQIDLFDNIS